MLPTTISPDRLSFAWTQVDPNQLLPSIELDMTAQVRQIQSFDIIHTTLGVIGRFDLATSTDTDAIYPACIISRGRRHGLRGVGVAAYLCAVDVATELSVNFESAIALSEGSVAIWNKFVKNSIATVVDPPHYDSEAERYYGKFVACTQEMNKSPTQPR